jgi:hypothetical protein
MYHHCTMSDDSRDVPSSNVPQADEARRRLLRGSLALPAVLTVSPGAAAALSAVNCAQPAPAGGQEAALPSLTDTWYRVEVTASKKIVDDGFLYYRVGGGASNNWYRITPATGDVARLSTAPLATDFYATTAPEYPASQVKYRVVQLYDAVKGTYGHPQAMGLENGWCTMACYYSMIN